CGYAGIALARLGSPFPLEVLESNSFIEVHRILAGQPLYAAPTVSYVPDGYPPLYFAVSAAAASALGQSYLALRLVSLASSLACHGWYLYYVFEQMSEHALSAAAVGQFWAGYLLPTLGLAVAAVLLGARGVPLVLLAGGAALAAEGYAALVHAGGGVNDLLPA